MTTKAHYQCVVAPLAHARMMAAPQTEETFRKLRAINDMFITLSNHCVYRLPGNSYHSRSLLTPAGMYYTMVLHLSSVDCVDRRGSFTSFHSLY